MREATVANMKTLPLSTLVRNPKSVKKLTAQGHTVHITEKGKPLWVVSAEAATSVRADESPESERARWIEDYFDELLNEPPSKGPSITKVLLESRGDR
jgi:hypothetical protein